VLFHQVSSEFWSCGEEADFNGGDPSRGHGRESCLEEEFYEVGFTSLCVCIEGILEIAMEDLLE